MTDTTHIEMTLEEFQAEARKRFGDPMNWKFRCPICETESTPADFKKVRGKKEDGNRAGQECIGRVMNEAGQDGVQTGKAGEPRITPGKGPCNWAAFGLLGVPRGGIRVTLPDGGQMWAFDLAEAPA